MTDPDLPNELTNRPSVVAFRPRRFRDDWGWFTESWNRKNIASLGLDGVVGETYPIKGQSERRNIDIVHTICRTLGVAGAAGASGGL